MKAVLVIDMPNRCSECPLCSKEENYWGDIVSAECQMQYKGYIANDLIKPNWCPLKLLPKKKNIDKTLEFGGYENIIQESLARGYNACLEQILGEIE